MTDPLRYARRLHDEAAVVLRRGAALLESCDGVAYGDLVRHVVGLLSSARWAAERPEDGERLMLRCGLELPEREADTRPGALVPR